MYIYMLMKLFCSKHIRQWYYLQGFADALGVKVKDQPIEEVGAVETDLSEGKLVVGTSR